MKKRPHDDFYDSKGLFNDIVTLRWMRVPCKPIPTHRICHFLIVLCIASSFKLLIIPVILFGILEALNVQPNPFKPMLFISHHITSSSPDDPRYAKGWLDIPFILYHIIVFSFIRQFTLFKIIFPVARKLGIKKQGKLDRFGEQAYAMLYYGTMGFWGAVSAVNWFIRTSSDILNKQHSIS